MMNGLSLKEKTGLFIQRFFCFGLYVLFLYPASWIFISIFRRYRIPELKSIRKEFNAICHQGNGPLLICANHLTFLDPFLIGITLRSFWNCLFQFHSLPWNLPKKSYMQKNWFYRFVFFAGKTVPVEREASVDTIKQTLQKIGYLLSRSEYILIFPEGTRSKSGRVDHENFTYSVGNLLRATENVRVLCVYFRGVSQKAACEFPPRGEKFICQLKLIQPQTIHQGLRAERDLATQVIQTLFLMEQDYFAGV